MSKLHLLDLEPELDYILICLHTALEDYRLAYFINKKLNLSLKRRDSDLDFKENGASYALYEYCDKAFFLTYNLIANKYLGVKYTTSKKNALFYNTLLGETKVSYLINDKKKVDYFLKISGDVSLHKTNCIIEKLNTIPQIVTCYTTAPKNIKQNAHLIF
ncbi:MAG: IPExxxVDY family protein [Flavobacteriaceae bacterium]|nr:IPExxxVDY family protein [Flavobacteriaceae bacterium]